MEITAKELRIGNLIFDHECEPYIFEVEQISKYVGSELWIRYRNDSIKTKTAEGIPLTGDWLLKFGFYVDKTKAYINYGEEKQMFQLNRIGNEFEFTWGAVPIKYVHTLQNIAYLLTQTELTLTK